MTTNNFKDKSLIIFDWDGTLMDSVGLIVDAMRYAAEKHGLTVSNEATKSIIGIALVDAFPMLFPNDSDKYDDCLLYTSPSPRDLSTSRMPSSA